METASAKKGDTPSEFTGGTIATFWTGGWDSTFRILDLVVHYGCRVQPVYVLDGYRKSSKNELDAIKRVRLMVDGRFPEKAHLLLPTNIVHRSQLIVPQKIRQQFAHLRSVFEIGWQYEWLAATVQHSDFDQIEVSFHADDNRQIFEFLSEHAIQTATECGAPTWKIRDWDSRDEYGENMKLFQNFSFPTLLMAKQEMDPIAKENNFADMLEVTWFCHYPFGSEPCGACYVCRHYVDSGLVGRFPKSALLRNKLWFIIHPARLLLANPDRFVERLRDKFKWIMAKSANN